MTEEDGGRKVLHRGLFLILSPKKKSQPSKPSVATVSCNHLLRPSAATTGCDHWCNNQLQTAAAPSAAASSCNHQPRSQLQPAATTISRDLSCNHQLHATVGTIMSCKHYQPPSAEAFSCNEASNHQLQLSNAAFSCNHTL
jgi:hypothetical protein